MDGHIFQNNGFDNNSIMAALALQKAFPLIPPASQESVAPNSLTSLLPYANMLNMMAGFDSSNLLGNLLNGQLQVVFPLGVSSAATCASSVVEPSESPANNENNNLQMTEPSLLAKQQFIKLPTTPSSSSPFITDESIQNSICKLKVFTDSI